VPPKLNPSKPPWYGPVCPVVGRGDAARRPPIPINLYGLESSQLRSSVIGRNASWVVVQVVVSTIVLFVVYYVLVRAVGIDQIGLLAIVSTMAVAARLSELGLSGAVTRFVAEYLARDERAEAGQVIVTAARCAESQRWPWRFPRVASAAGDLAIYHRRTPSFVPRMCSFRDLVCPMDEYRVGLPSDESRWRESRRSARRRSRCCPRVSLLS